MKVLFLFFTFLMIFHHLQAQFFTQYWAEFDGKISNTENLNERLRSHDESITIHPVYSKSHIESHINGLQLIMIDEIITEIKYAEVLLEMWGGHPKTENKRFTINGRGTYHIPCLENSIDQSEYIFPEISITTSDLVTGINAFQFACNRGTTFWGTFIVDEMAVRCYLKDDDVRIKDSGLYGFSAIPSIAKMEDITHVSLKVKPEYADKILNVSFIARFDGYDDRGDRAGNNWHGYTFKRKYTNHIGSTDKVPYSVEWDTRLIPTQGKAMAVKAIIEFQNGLLFESDVLDNLWFNKERPLVLLLHSTNVSEPFWSRVSNLKTASIILPVNPKEIEKAELIVRIWDGGEGEVREPFKLNGVAYPVISGKANHDLVFTKHQVCIENLKYGENIIELISDTEHHGIEVLLPFPALIVRMKK
jgi:hypothetical protein